MFIFTYEMSLNWFEMDVFMFVALNLSSRNSQSNSTYSWKSQYGPPSNKTDSCWYSEHFSNWSEQKKKKKNRKENPSFTIAKES